MAGHMLSRVSRNTAMQFFVNTLLRRLDRFMLVDVIALSENVEEAFILSFPNTIKRTASSGARVQNCCGCGRVSSTVRG